MFFHISNSLSCHFSISHLLSLSTTASLSLSLSLSLSHHISLSLMVGYSSVGHGSGVEVRLRMSRLAWYSGDFWVFWVQIGVFKLFPAWFAPWFPLNKCRQAELYLPWKCETKRRKWTSPGSARLGYSMVFFLNLTGNEGFSRSCR